MKAFFLVLLLCTQFLYAQTITTYEVNPVADTHVTQEGQNRNYGSESILDLKTYFAGTRLLIKFDEVELKNLLNGKDLVNARLELPINNHYVKVTGTIGLHKMNVDWSETKATWNCPSDSDISNNAQDCPNPWLMWSHDPNNTTPYPYEISPFITGTIIKDQTVPVGFDLKSYVIDITSGNISQNFGFAVFKNSTNINDPLSFYSRESDVGPKLILQIKDKEPVSAKVEAKLVSSATFGLAPLSVHLDASSSKAKNGTTITKYELDYGNGSFVALDKNNPKFDHVYAQEGEYQAILKITDSDGESDFSVVNISVYGNENSNLDSNYGYWINIPSDLKLKYGNGEKAVLKGDICKIWKTQNREGNCQWVDKQRLNIRAFFPDMTSPVTSYLTIARTGERRTFSYETPVLDSLNLNTFTVVVGEVDPKSLQVAALKSKFDLRVLLIDRKILEFKAQGIDQKVINALEVVRNNLQSISNKIEQRNAKVPSILAQYNLPLQVGNKVSAARYYSTMVGGFRFELSSDVGNLIKGDYPEIRSRITNINYNSHVPHDLESYRFKYSYKNQDLITQTRPTFKIGDVQEYIFKDPSRASLTDFYSFGVEIEEKFKWWGRKLGGTDFSMPVFDDTETPEWLNPTLGISYHKNFPLLIEKVSDKFGRLDSTTFNAQVSGTKTQDISSKFVLSTTTKGTEYLVQGDLRTELNTEGEYLIKYSISDFAGHVAIPEDYKKTIIVDRTAPLILLPFTDPFTTNLASFPLPITFADRTNTALKVFVNGIKQIDYSTLSDNSSFELDVALNEGINLIRIEATDAVGNNSVVSYPAIILDTTPPALANLNLTAGQVIRTAAFDLQGTASEALKEVIINGETIEMAAGASGFQKRINHAVEGEQNLEITLTDLIGNSRTYNYGYSVQLNILRIELVGISPTPEGRLQVTGSPGAANPGIDLEISGGFFNSESLFASEDGSFSVVLDPFTTAEIIATDSANSIEEKYSIKFNANTTLSGVVKDPFDEPIPGVTVTIASSGQTTTTDLQGVFNIPNPALGDQKLLIDGATIPASYTQGLKEFAAVTINVAIGNLQQNIIERPIYISPKLLDGSETVIQPNTAVVVESVHAPGVSLEIPANAVTFPEGVTPTINMMEIDAKKTSVELPEGVEPATVVALEPSGLKFKEPIKLTLPNTNEFPDGMELVILSKNSTTGLWEVDGSANVVGNQIETKPGQGITHFSEVFASPFGMEMSSMGPADKPGIENKIGDLTTSVSLPSYLRLGNRIEPKLIYKSSWANPTAIVSNVFNLPRKYYEFRGSLSQGSWAGSAKISSTIQTWLTPDSIDTQFFVKDIASEKLTFRADKAPEQAVVSYAVDLGELKSGVYPASATYEVKYHNFTLRTTKIKVRSLFSSKTKIIKNVENDSIESIFPPDLRSLVYHQNKKNSEFGSGWKLATTQKILNPGEDRVMIENEDGSVSSYTLKNSVETIYTDINEIDSAYLNGTNIFVSDVKNEVKNVSSGSATSIRTLPNYQGNLGANLETHWRYDSNHHVLKCTNFTVPYSAARKVNYLFPMGNSLVYSDSLGAILNVANDIPVAGTYRSFETLESVNSVDYQSHCRAYLGVNCSTSTSTQRYYYILKPYTHGSEAAGDCTNPSYCYKSGNAGCISSRIESSGLMPSIGYSTGYANMAKLNNPMAIISGQEANTLIVADSGNNLVRKINLNNNTITNIVGNQQTYDNGDGNQALNASLFHPRGLAYDVQGNLYISTENGYIRKVSPSGIISTLAGKPLGQGGQLVENGPANTFNLKTPSGLVVDNDNGYLYVADTGNHRIVQIDLLEGVARSVVGNTQCLVGAVKEGSNALQTSICNPVHIGLDENRNLIYLDKANKKVRKVILSENQGGIQRFASSALDNSELIKNIDGSYLRKYRDGSKVSFNNLGLEIKFEALNGMINTFDYDEASRLISITDSTGSRSTIQYSGERVASFSDPAGRVTQFSYNGNLLTEVSFGDGTSKSFTYNGNDLLTQEVDQRGYATQYSYNLWNRISSIRNSDNSVVQVEDYQSKTLADSFNGSTRKLINYSENEKKGLTDSIKDAKNAETKFIRNSFGHTSTIVYPNLKETTFERDIDGRPTKITRPDGTYTIFTYDSTYGDLLTKYESSTDSKESYTYNERGQLTKYIDHAGRMTQNSYDQNTGLLVLETDSNNLSVSRTYGQYGLLSTVTNSLSLTHRYEYDMHGNLAQVTLPSGENTSFVQDAAGNTISKIDAKNQATNYTFDTFNRVLSVENSSNNKTTFSYLESGELSNIRNAEGNLTHFDYDSMGRLIKKTTPLGQITQLKYDNNGNVIQEIDSKGQSKVYEYNELDQLIRKELPDNIYTFSYTDSGQLKTIADNDSAFEYNYTNIHGKEYLNGIRQTVLDIPENIITHSLDNLGRRKGFHSDYISLNFAFNNMDQLTSVRNDKNEIYNYEYDSAYRLKKISNPTGLITTFEFDANSFLKSKMYKKFSNQDVLSQFQYERDNIGNRISMSTLYGVHNYQYDSDNQLTSATNPEGNGQGFNETFVYDSLGNKTHDGTGASVFDSKGFQLEEDYKYFYAYDSNGNLVTKQEKGMNGNLMNITYSSENQVTSIDVIENGMTRRRVEFRYDALGRRTQKKTLEENSFKTRKYIYDGDEIVAELNNENEVLLRYTHSGLKTDDTLAIDVTAAGVSEQIAPSSGTYYFVKDGLGSVIDIVNSSGSVVQHYTYSSFGKILSISNGGVETTNSPLIKTSYTYTNREYDFETGLYYYRARYLDPHSGRFIQQDPHPGFLLSPLTFSSSYIYGLNNPTLNTDPSGRIVPIIIAAALIGGFVNAYTNKDKGSFLQNFAAGAFVGAVSAGVGLAFTAGAATFLGAGAGSAFISGAIGGAAASASSQLLTNGSVTWSGVLLGAALGGISNLVVHGLKAMGNSMASAGHSPTPSATETSIEVIDSVNKGTMQNLFESMFDKQKPMVKPHQ